MGEFFLTSFPIYFIGLIIVAVFLTPANTQQDNEIADNMNVWIERNFGRRRHEFEFVRSLLRAHRESLGRELSELSTAEDSDDNVEDELEERSISDSDKQHTEGAGGEEDLVHRSAPEILDVNRRFREYLYQGDIALTARQAQFLFGKRHRRQSLNGENYPEFKWPRNISYSFDNNLDNKTIGIIRKAINFWLNNTCLNFDENPKAPLRLEFTKANGCWSYVGRASESDEPQPISIGDGCEHFAVASHEIAHALGFFHAQSRFDRDAYVRFKVRNVASGFEDQFAKENIETNNNYGVKYDYGSVLHYSNNAFAKTNKKPVLIAIEPHNQNTMGQRIKPSFSDVLIMNRHYNCLSECEKSLIKCKNGGYANPKNCSVCICPWGFGGDTCEERASSSGAIAPQNCGQTISAKSQWNDLNATIGSAEKIIFSEHSSCHFHITAPEGRQIQIKVVALGRVCSSGCFYGNTEFKIGKNFTRTGIRMCCTSDVRGQPILSSQSNLVVISLYTRFYLQSFRIRYRYI